MTLYQPGLRAIQDVGYGLTSQRITCLPEVGGAVLDPSSYTVDIMRDGESMENPTITAGVPTEDSTTHLLTYSLDASNTGTWSLGLPCVALFKYTAGSVARSQRVMFDIVRVPLYAHPPCNTKDVLNCHATLEDAMQQAGLTTDGTTTADPDATPYINEAWADVLEILRSRGRRPALVTDVTAFAPTLRALSRVRVLRALFIQPNDLYDKLADAEQKYADEAMTSLSNNLRYDEGDNGGAGQPVKAFMQPRLSPFRGRGLR